VDFVVAFHDPAYYILKRTPHNPRLERRVPDTGLQKFVAGLIPFARRIGAGLILFGALSLAMQYRQNADAQATPFVEPEVRRSSRGLLQTVLEMKLAKANVGGRTIEVGTYEGTIPGPTLVIKPGDLLKFRLINNLTLPGATAPAQHLVFERDVYERSMNMMRGMVHAMADAHAGTDPQEQLFSNIHTHGLQVDASGNADNPFLLFKPGETFDYQIQVPSNQPAGFDWYHPHKHGSTAKQLWAGMTGAIVVEGDLDRIPLVAAAEQKVMILNELWIDVNGHVPIGMPIPVAGHHGHAPFSSIPAIPSDTYYTINGIYQPTITIHPGQTQRWRIVNAAPHRLYHLTLDGHTMYQIAQDGIAFAAPRAEQTILVAPGNRIEVMIIGGNPGSYKFRALEYDQGHPGGAMPEDVLATVVSQGARMRQAIPTRLLTPDDIAGNIVDRRRTVRFRGSTLHAPVEFFIDDKPFDPDRDDQTIKVGTTEEWSLVNEDVFQHPFHIHVNPFQVVEINGNRIANPVWWDTFALPPKGTVKILMHPRTDVMCRTVYHCHILPHEDNGMMSAFSLVK
jgi:FtsP/CotA-like multicopper oxidase with cupredoxin domain